MQESLNELATANIAPEEFVGCLQAYAANSRPVNHPLLLALAKGDFCRPDEALRDFFGQYYFYSYGFTQYLGALMARLESPQHRALLIGNLAEEAGHLDPEHEQVLRGLGIEPEFARAPHPVLFRRFLKAIGLDTGQFPRGAPDVTTLAWVRTFQALCRSEEQAEAVGAMGIATEAIVRHMYAHLLEGIRLAWPEMPLRDRVFFDLHANVDEDHAKVLQRIAADLACTPEGRTNLLAGVVRALDARENFYDHMLLKLRGLYHAAGARGQAGITAAGGWP